MCCPPWPLTTWRQRCALVAALGVSLWVKLSAEPVVLPPRNSGPRYFTPTLRDWANANLWFRRRTRGRMRKSGFAGAQRVQPTYNELPMSELLPYQDVHADRSGMAALMATPAPGAIRAVRERFVQRFGVEPRVFRAPGRVNLIGEHTDYNEGFVMPAAIEFATWVAAAPRNDATLAIDSLDFHEYREVKVDDTSRNGPPQWSDYVRGVAVMLAAAGVPASGASLVIHGNVPIGAGLSSSASIEVAAALALTAIAGVELDRTQLAQLCQRAENEFVGARCGIMDQFIAVHGRAAHALLLDCRSLQYERVPVPDAVSIVICNTMVHRQLSGGEYNTRRAQCEEGVRLLQGAYPGITALRDVSPDQLDAERNRLPEVIYRRCRHVVEENARVLAMRDALRRHDLKAVGTAMAGSHRSLRYEYEVSCPELDLMVELACGVAGTIGARMTGGGFGGCTVNLVDNEAVAQFRSEVGRGYCESTGREPEIYVSAASDGAAEVV